MAKIIYLSTKKSIPADGYWDMAFLEDTLRDIGEKADRTIFIIPGAYQGSHIDEINKELNKHKKIMVFITSDEEGKFDSSKLKHGNMILYSQYGCSSNYFPLGYTPHTRPVLRDIGILEKDKDWFFSGQVTHKRRIEMEEALKDLPDGLFNGTDGFAKGMPHWDYFSNILSSHSVVCPPGAIVQDNFRMYETLEAGVVPIVDKYSATMSQGYWEKNMSDAPFPILESYKDLPKLIEKCKDIHYSNKVYAWWIAKKFQIREDLKDQLGIVKDQTSVIMSTSPIASHPSTRIIDETIKSVRVHTNSPIYITIDGVRPEQKHMRDQYEEYIKRLLWDCNFKYENVVPFIFDEHKHQSGMLKEILKLIDTPMLIYVEHDTPFVTDRKIEFKYLKNLIMRGEANLIRFHFEDVIPEEHEYLMLGEPEDFLQKTAQWSQRPHIAKTSFYRNILNFFSPDSKCFIEDRVYGKLYEDFKKDGMEGWKKWRVFIYHPDGGIKRSTNLDGRGHADKYDDTQIW